MMAETCLLAEAAICYPPLFNELRALAQRPTATAETVAMSAVAAAIEQNAGAILVMSTSGNTARLVSKNHPPCPIITSECWAGTRSNLLLMCRIYSHPQRSDLSPGSLAPWLLPDVL